MPIYIFCCENLDCNFYGKSVELLLKAGVVPTCGNCGETMQKQITKAGIKMRGGASPSRCG